VTAPFHAILPVPPASNRYWRMGGGRLYKSAEAREYQADLVARLTKLKRKPYRPPVTLDVTLIWYRGRKQGDLDGRVKVLLDCMQCSGEGVGAGSGKYGIYENDNQIRRLVAELIDVEPADAGMEVIVKPYEGPVYRRKERTKVWIPSTSA
jgi:Holliday junction resolvase RusA-like endonuclease